MREGEVLRIEKPPGGDKLKAWQSRALAADGTFRLIYTFVSPGSPQEKWGVAYRVKTGTGSTYDCTSRGLRARCAEQLQAIWTSISASRRGAHSAVRAPTTDSLRTADVLRESLSSART